MMSEVYLSTARSRNNVVYLENKPQNISDDASKCFSKSLYICDYALT